jgi:5-methylcytosine-specific restriction endonuclease McrA
MADWPYSTTAWQRLRRLKLSETPLCQTCALRGRYVIAEAVDHVVSIARGGHAFPALTGLRSLCPGCHSIKTNALDLYADLSMKTGTDPSKAVRSLVTDNLARHHTAA